MSSPRQVLRRTNLELVLADPEIGGPAELARLIDKPKMKAHLSNVRAGRRGMGDDLAAAIERAAGHAPGWMDQQHQGAGEAPAAYTVARPVSHPTDSDDLPLMIWEDLMKLPVPEIFRAALPDDALAPEFPKGTEIVWTTRRRIAPGRIVLLRDRHGTLHARICHQGREPGQWLAMPTNSAFISLASTEEGLQVLAVYKGRLEPDDH
jgi:hypothetical protein